MYNWKWKAALNFILIMLIEFIPITLHSQWAVKVGWNPNQEPDIMGYKLYYGTVSKNYDQSKDVGNTTTYRVENLQGMVEYFFAVTAYDTARNESNYSIELSCVLGDTILPSIILAEAVSSNLVVLSFSEALDSYAAQQKENYSISNGIAVLSAVLDKDRQRVRLTTSEHEAGASYTVSVTGVTDIALPPNSVADGTGFTYTYGGGVQDETPPTITAAEPVSATQLNVYFSEPLDPAVANNKDNYSLNNGVEIQSASLDANGNMVQLTTSAHQYGLVYILRVNNVKDVAGNTILANNSYSYTFEPVDQVGPTLTLVSAVDATHLDVMYSEEVERTSAEDLSNYSISDGIEVLSARLAGSGRVVNLETGTHEPDHLYYLAVSGVHDVSPQANEIEPNSNYAYTYEPEDQVGPTIRTVRIVDAAHIEVVFNETIEETSAEEVGHYSLDNEMTIISAELQGNGNTVALHTSDHRNGQMYVLTINGVRDNSPAGNEITPNSTYTYVYGNGSTNIGPTIVEVKALSSTELLVEFSNNLDKVSAESISHYFLNNNVTVQSARLEDSNKNVRLTTTEHEWGKIYILRISNVKDTIGNMIQVNSSYAYVYEPADVVGPTLTLVNVVDATHVDLMFSEKVDRSSAETVTNYSISGGIDVLSARLAGTGRLIRLETTAHDPNRLYLVMVKNVHDTSPQENIIEPNISYAYMFEPDDMVEPTIRLVRVLDENHLEVLFSEQVAAESVKDIDNYSLNNGLNIIKAELTGNGRTVILETTSHEIGRVYVLLVSNVCDNSQAANEIAPNSSYTYVFGDSRTSHGLTIVEAEGISATEVRVEFSKRVSKASAELVSNYRLNHDLRVIEARLGDTGMVVYLTTTQQREGALNTLTVNNISAADNPAEVIRPNSQYFYIFEATQGMVPTVTDVSAIGETFMTVGFSSPVDRVTAENRRNYAINNRMSILSAELDNSDRIVYLETSRHAPARPYILSISGVTSESNADPLGINSSIAYTYIPQLRLEFLSDVEVQLSYTEVGREYYVDRNYVVTYVPEELVRERLIKTCNNDNINSDSRYLAFQLNQPATVYVAYDSRATSVPNWLDGYFTKTDDYIGVSDWAEQLILWKRDYPAGDVVLGGNNAVGATGAKSMYTVLVKENPSGGSSDDDDLEGGGNGDGIPHTVELLQNYPNPFNPLTTISFELPSQKQVTVEVFNILGRRVKKLFDGMTDAGLYQVVWDATDEHGNPVSAGIYFYRLVAWDETERNGAHFNENYQTVVRKMTLIK